MTPLIRRALVTLVVLVALASPVAAQNPVNPQAWSFDHEDSALATSYVFGWFASATNPAPVQEAPIAKPSACSPCAITTPLPSTPLAFQTWYAGVRAVAGAATSGWSNLVPFDSALRAPTNLQAK